MVMVLTSTSLFVLKTSLGVSWVKLCWGNFPPRPSSSLAWGGRNNGFFLRMDKINRWTEATRKLRNGKQHWERWTEMVTVKWVNSYWFEDKPINRILRQNCVWECVCECMHVWGRGVCKTLDIQYAAFKHCSVFIQTHLFKITMEN